MNGFFKVRMRRFQRWFVFRLLPNEQIYDEWLYFDKQGVPMMYWNKELGRLVLFG